MPDTESDEETLDDWDDPPELPADLIRAAGLLVPPHDDEEE